MTPTLPASLAAGNLLVAFCYNTTTNTNIIDGWSAPTGWTQYAGWDDIGPLYIFYKYAAAGETAPTFTPTKGGSPYSSGSSVAALMQYANPAPTTPLRSVAYHADTTSATAHVAPSVSATSGDALIVAAMWPGTAFIGSGPTGMAQRVSESGSLALYAFDQSGLSAGATGTKTVTQSSSSSSGYAVSLLLRVPNNAPNAPTPTSPANNSTIDRGITQRFAWQFSDPDAGDSQSQFDLQWWPLDGTGTRTASATTITSATPNTYYDFASGYFAAGDYEWQVRTYDSQGVVGPWSSSSFFTAATAPSPATITAPTSGATVTNTATLTWSAPNQSDYQWRRAKDNAGSADTGTIYHDSGDVVDSTTRSVTVTFDTNNRWEHLQVRIKDNGLWSSWSDVRVQVAYTPPATPTYTLTFDTDPTSPTAGTALVSITNPSGSTATASNNIYVTDPGQTEERRATGIAANGTWRYWTPPSGFDPPTVGALRVEAVGSNGTTAST